MRTLGPRSLQARLALSLAAVYLAATAVAVGVLLYQSFSTADALSKEDLSRRAKHLAALAVNGEDGQPRIELPDWLASLYRSGTFIYAVNGPNGRPVSSSSSEAGDLVIRLPAADAEAVYFRLRNFGEGQRDYFGLTQILDSKVGSLRVTIARAADDDTLVRALLREFVLNIAWLVPLMVAATLGMGIFAIRRGLRSVREVSASAAAIDPGSISARLSTASIPAEIQPLVVAVNQALDRLEKGFAVQRQFTANAAHQLRTPLSILTAALEQLGTSAAIASLRKDAARMNRLVEQLLRVARLDAIALDVSETVDLSAVARDVVSSFAPIALASSCSLAAQGADQAVLVQGNRFAIEDALRNLVENAIAHSPPSTEVVVSVGPTKSVSVVDLGAGVAPPDRERIFERFWRGSGHQSQGSGLGLAIVSEIMKAHHGTVQVGDNPAGGAVFILDFANRGQATSRPP